MQNQCERTTPRTGSCFGLFALVLVATAAHAAVTVERVPDAGLQPQVATASDGTVHLVYLVGDPKSADIHYRRRHANETNWSASMRVNSQARSAVAIGTIRGPQLALGRNGCIHVCWNGSRSETPMLYSRLEDKAKGFAPQRNLMTTTHELDGGGSIAADADGRVFVVWHAAPAGSSGETKRAVYLALSSNDGNTFGPERRISPTGTGACPCCALTAFANPRGETFVLFRTARSGTQRDMMLLVSGDHGERFEEAFTHPWSVGMCPMSSASLAMADEGTWAAWETASRVYAARFVDASQKNFTPRLIDSPKGAKHPRVVTNLRGETLVVWVEGSGWQRGGALAWQLLDRNGEPTDQRGKREGIPAWSHAAAFARADNGFVILY